MEWTKRGRGHYESNGYVVSRPWGDFWMLERIDERRDSRMGKGTVTVVSLLGNFDTRTEAMAGALGDDLRRKAESR